MCCDHDYNVKFPFLLQLLQTKEKYFRSAFIVFPETVISDKDILYNYPFSSYTHCRYRFFQVKKAFKFNWLVIKRNFLKDNSLHHLAHPLFDYKIYICYFPERVLWYCHQTQLSTSPFLFFPQYYGFFGN